MTASQRKGIEWARGKDTASVVVSASGDTVLKTPAAGNRLTLHWAYLSSSQNNSQEVFATVRLGATTIYSAYLGNPGAFAHRETVEADAAGDALILNLSVAGQNVAVNWTTTEI